MAVARSYSTGGSPPPRMEREALETLLHGMTISALVSVSVSQKAENAKLRPLFKFCAGRPVHANRGGQRVEGVIVWEAAPNDPKKKKQGWIKEDGTNKTPAVFAGTARGTYSAVFLSDSTNALDVELRTAAMHTKVGGDGKQLMKTWGSLSPARLHSLLFANVAAPRSCYRVCRPNEAPENADSLRPRREMPANLATHDYFLLMWDHISDGTARQPFISCTSLLRYALWWSLFGALPLVRIDCARVKALQPLMLIWDFNVDKARDQCLPNSHMQHMGAFAKRAFEIIFDSPIPRGAFFKLPVKWLVLRQWRSPDTPESFAMLPYRSTFCPHEELDELEVLAGSTYPIRAKLKRTGQVVVLKRGTGHTEEDKDSYGHSKFQAASRHCINEFFANCMYRLLGAPVPDASLVEIEVQIQVDGDIIKRHVAYVLFFQFLRGGPADLAQQATLETVRNHFHVDLLLRNFDMCGGVGQNLLVSEHRAFRIDVGGSLLFSARGEHRSGKPDSWLEDFLGPDKQGKHLRQHVGSSFASRRGHAQLLERIKKLPIKQLITRQDLCIFPEWAEALTLTLMAYQNLIGIGALPTIVPAQLQPAGEWRYQTNEIAMQGLRSQLEGRAVISSNWTVTIAGDKDARHRWMITAGDSISLALQFFSTVLHDLQKTRPEHSCILFCRLNVDQRFILCTIDTHQPRTPHGQTTVDLWALARQLSSARAPTELEQKALEWICEQPCALPLWLDLLDYTVQHW